MGGETQTGHSMDMRDTRIEHGVTWRVLGSNYEGARNPRWGYTYEALIGERAYRRGENPECDIALAEALAQDAKITAGDIYRDFPEIVVEELMILADIETPGNFPADPAFPATPTASHDRFVLRRKLQPSWEITTVAR